MRKEDVEGWLSYELNADKIDAFLTRSFVVGEKNGRTVAAIFENSNTAQELLNLMSNYQDQEAVKEPTPVYFDDEKQLRKGTKKDRKQLYAIRFGFSLDIAREWFPQTAAMENIMTQEELTNNSRIMTQLTTPGRSPG